MSFSPCGINCGECPFEEQCGGGCFAIEGKPFYIKDFGLETCLIYDCAVNQKGLKHCGGCTELPCQIWYDWRDPDMSEEAHLQSIKDRSEALKAL